MAKFKKQSSHLVTLELIQFANQPFLSRQKKLVFVVATLASHRASENKSNWSSKNSFTFYNGKLCLA